MLSMVNSLVPFVLAAAIIAVSRLDAQEPPTWKAVPDLRIGQIDGPLALTRIDALVVTEGGVVIGQTLDKQILVFGEDGTLHTRIGSHGQGPGEFLRVDAVAMIEGELVVVDRGNKRLSYLTPEGRLTRTSELHYPSSKAPPPFAWLGPLVPLREGRMLFTGSWGMMFADRTAREMEVIVGDATTGEMKDSLPSITWGDRNLVLYSEEFHMSGWRPLFRGTRFSTSSNGRYFVTADGDERRVHVSRYDVTSRERVGWDVDSPEVRVPEALADSIETSLVDNFIEGRAPFPRKTIQEAVAIPRKLPGVDQIQAMDDGSIWFSEPKFGAGERVWHVLGPGPSEHATVLVPEGIQIRGRRGEVLWGTAYDGWDVAYLVRLQLERSGR